MNFERLFKERQDILKDMITTGDCRRSMPQGD